MKSAVLISLVLLGWCEGESPLDKVRAAAFRHECTDARPYDASAIDTPPAIFFHPLPSLPPHRESIHDDVILEAVVLDDGSICDARIVKGYSDDIDAVCLDAVRHWKFRPAMRNSVAVATYETVKISLSACPTRG